MEAINKFGYVAEYRINFYKLTAHLSIYLQQIFRERDHGTLPFTMALRSN